MRILDKSDLQECLSGTAVTQTMGRREFEIYHEKALSRLVRPTIAWKPVQKKGQGHV
jgi:hypothetical protein